jgi:plastocyanin
MRKLTLWSLLVALVLVLAACGGNDTGSSGDESSESGSDVTEGAEGAEGEEGAAQNVTFTAGNELKYDPETATASVGDVTITLDNTGALEHNIVWVEEGDPEEPFVYTAGGENASNTRTFDAPGEYQFYCSIPGHREAGMDGALTITE